jgi:hypothetical protein
LAISWQAGQDPGGTPFANFTQAMTIVAIRGTPEVALGSAGTITVVKAANGIPLSSGTPLHSGTFNANGTPATDQNLTVTVPSLVAGDRIGLVSTGGTAWASGSAQGLITVIVR